MAAVFGKNIKLPNAQARCMLLINSVKNSNRHLKNNFHLCFPKQTRLLSTAAQKLVVSDDLLQRKSKYQENESLNNKPSKNVDNAFADIDVYARRAGRVFKQSVEDVLSLIKDAGSVSSTQGLYLLRCCELIIDEAPPKKIEFADAVWEMLQSYGVQFDVSHYNSRLRLYVANMHDFSPGEFLSTMESQAVEPNKVTYRYLMEKCCDDGNLTAASEILEFLKKKNIPVDESIFNALIKGYINSGDFEGAENILEVMKSSSLSPNADSYTALACGRAKRGDIGGMKEYLRPRDGVSLTNKHLLQVIDALAVSGHPQEVEEILSQMDNIKDYRQDFINAAVALIHKDLEDVGYRLLMAASSPSFNVGTNIFLKQLIKNRKPIEKVIQYSDRVFQQGLNNIILLNLVRAAIDYEMMDYAIPLLQEMHKKGLPVRDYYFTSIFSYYKGKNSPEGVLLTLKKMFEMGVPPDFTVYRHRVLPAIGIVNVQDFIAKLEQYGLPTPAAIDALFDFYCHVGRSDLALNLLESNTVCVNPNFDVKNYLSDCRNSDLSPSIHFKVLKFILENIGLYKQEEEVMRGKLLAEFIQTDAAMFDTFRKRMDFNISLKCQKVCQDILRKESPQLMVHLRRTVKDRDMSAEDEEKHLASLKSQGLSTSSFMVERLLYHIKKRNIGKVNEIRATLEEQGFEFSPGVCAQLLNMYSEANDIQATQKLMQSMKEKNPDFQLDTMKAIDYASLLIKYEKYDDAIEILKSTLADTKALNKSLLRRQLQKLFNIVAETKSLDFVKKIHDLFMPFADKIVQREIILELLVKAHVYREDLRGALDEFRSCVSRHRETPCLGLLLCKCIVSEDREALQAVVNLTTSHFGESLASLELAAALVETGRPAQALQVVETLGSKADEKHLEAIYTRMCTRNRSTVLEQFLLITKTMTHISRENTYHFLLSLFAERNNVEQALRVWKLMEKEGIKPSQQASRALCDVYRRTGGVIPPDVQVEAPPEEQEGPLASSLSSNSYKEAFMQHVRSRNADKALEELKRMKKGYVRSIGVGELSQFVDLLVQQKSLLALSPNVAVMSYLIERANEVFGPILAKYSEAGDVEALASVSGLLPDFSLKKLSFNYFYCKAFIVGGRQEDLMLEMEKSLGNRNKTFSISAFQDLLKFPALEERCLELAVKYLELNFEVPISAAWAHYFVSESYEKSESIQKQHAVSFEKVDPTILGTIRRTQNVSLGRKYIEVLNGHPTVRQRTKERAYGALLDVLVLTRQYDEAASLAAEGESQGLPLHKYYTSTLITLKNALERENKPVPFSVTTQEMSSLSSHIV